MNFGFGHSFVTPAAIRRAVNPILFQYSAGDDIDALGGTFSRASSATYIGQDGLIASAGLHAPRDSHYINGNRHLLLEGQRTKLAIANVESWSTQSDTTVGSGADYGPDGVFGEIAQLYHSSGEDLSPHGAYTTVSVPSAGTYTLSVWVRGGIGSSIYLYLHEGHQRVKIDFQGVDVWQRVSVTGGISSAGDIYPVFDTQDRLNGTENLPSVGYQATRPQIESGSFESSTIFSSFGDSASRAADSLSFPFPHAPQEMSVFTRFVIPAPPASIGSGRIAMIGASSFLYALLQDMDGGFRTYLNSTGAGLNEIATVNPTVNAGDTVEMLTQLSSSGTITTIASVNQGVESSATDADGNLPASWSEGKLWVGSVDYSAFSAFRDIIIARGGARDFDWFRARLSA